jgi:hypothetical protein
MSNTKSFEDLVCKLLAASDLTQPVPLTITDDEAGILRTGLERALLDRAAFDSLIVLYVGWKSRTETFPHHLRQTILEKGLGSLDGLTIASLAVSPDWIAELWEALITPSQYWLDAADRLRWGTSTGPRFPGRVLLGIQGPVASATLRFRLRREIEDAVSLAPSLPNARLTKWATDRLCGSEPLSDGHRLPFFQAVAEVIREVREAGINRVFFSSPAGHSTRVGSETLAELPAGASLERIASEVSEAAAALAQASRALKACDPILADTLLFSYYGGLRVPEVAALLGRSISAIQDELADAEDWVRGQTTFRMITSNETESQSASTPSEASW